MLKLERKWEMKKVEKSENNKSDYVQMEWVEKKELEMWWFNLQKWKKGKKRKEYLPRLSDDLPGNRCMFYLCFGGVQRIDHKLELSHRAHYIVKPSKNEVMRILEEENVFMNYRWLSRSLVIPVSYTHLTLPTKRIV